MADIIFNAGVRLKLIDSSLDDIQQKLNNLKPDSKAYSQLSNVFKKMRDYADDIRIQMSKPVTDKSQLKTIGKDINNFEEGLLRAKQIYDKLEFSDLKMTPGLQEESRKVKQQIEDMQTALTQFKAQIVKDFLNSGDNLTILKDLDPEAETKSLDELEKVVQKKIKNINKEIKQLEEQNSAEQTALRLNSKIQNFRNADRKSPNSLFGNDWNQFFNITNRGLAFKPGMKDFSNDENPLFQYLSQQFSLTEGQKDQLKALAINSAKFTAKELLDTLQGEDFWAPQTERANAANTTTNANQARIEALQASAQQAENIYKEIQDVQGKVSTKTEKVKTNTDNLTASFRENATANERASQSGSWGTLTGEIQSLREELDRTTASFLKMERSKRLFNSIKMAITNFMGFYQVMNLVKKAVTDAYNHIKTLDSAMNAIAVVSNDLTTADLWKQVDQYSAAAQRYGVSIEGAYEVSKIYYQAGYDTSEVMTLMNETLKLAQISGLDYATTTDYMMTAMRGFKLEMQDASRVVDVYSALAANTAVSQQELAEAITRTASSMQSVGATFEDTSAMIATVVAVTRETATNIGSAMKSIASRYGELTKDPAKLIDSEGEAMSFNKVDAALQSVGISMKTVDGQFRDFTSVIVELAEKWDTLDSVSQRYIATQFAGNRQQSRFLALVSNVDLLKENMEVAANSEDIGTLQALEKLDSLEAKLNQVKVAYQQFYTTMGAEDWIKGFLGGLKNIINNLNHLPKAFGKFPVVAIAFISNFIQLIKKGLESGIVQIAEIFKRVFTEVKQETDATSNEMYQKGQNIGQSLANGIRNGTKTIGGIFSNLTQVGGGGFKGFLKGTFRTPESIARQTAETRYQQFNSSIFAFKHNTGIDPNIDRQLANALVSNGAAGEDLLKLSGDKLHTQLAELTKDEEGLKNAMQASILATSNQQKAQQKLASGMASLASGLSMISMLFDQQTEGGRTAAGVFQMLAAAAMAAQAAMQAASHSAGWVGVALSAVVMVVSSISTLYETTEEKVERLTKEAEELSNKAKQTKSDQRTLETGIKKVKELEQERYKSAEAAEEYQNAAEDLANSFPELIAGFDEAGNVILKTVDYEAMLTKAREKSAKAAYDAAIAEWNARQGQIDDIKHKIDISATPSRSSAAGPDFEELALFMAENKDAKDNYFNWGQKDRLKWYNQYATDIADFFSDDEATLKKIVNLFEELAENSVGLESDLNIIVANFMQFSSSIKEEVKSSNSLNVLAKENLLKQFNNQTEYDNWEDFRKSGKIKYSFQEDYINFYNSLTEKQQEQFEKDFANSNITSEDLIKKWNLSNYTSLYNDVMTNEAETYITRRKNIEDEIKSLNFKNISNDFQIGAIKDDLNNFLSLFGTQISQLESDVLHLFLNEIERYDTSNLFYNGSFMLDIFSIYSEIEDKDFKEALFSQILQNGINTKEGLEKTLLWLKNNYDVTTEDSQWKKIYDTIFNIQESLIENVVASSTAALDTVTSELEEATKHFKELNDGIDLSDVAGLVERAKALGVQLNPKEFIQQGDKYLLNIQQYGDYIQAYLQDIFNLSDQAIQTYERIQSGKLDYTTLTDKDFAALGINKDEYEKLDSTKQEKLFLQQVRILSDSYNSYIFYRNEWFDNQIQSALELGDFTRAQVLATVRDKKDTREALEEVIGDNVEYQEAYQKGLQKQAKDTLDIMAEVLESGIDGYLTITDENKDALSKIVKDKELKVGDKVKITQEQIIEATENGTIDALAELAKSAGDYTSYNKIKYQKNEKAAAFTSIGSDRRLSREDAQKLAEALGKKSIKDIETEYNLTWNDVEDSFIISLKGLQEAAKDLAEQGKSNVVAAIKDLYEEICQGISDLVVKGLTGELTSSEVLDLQRIADENNLNIGTLNFESTETGLALATDSAIKLYNALLGVNNAAASKVFDALNEKLTKTGEICEDIYATTAEIVKTEAALNLDKNNDALKARLKLYKQIAGQQLMESGHNYDLMKHDLAAGLQNPLDFASSWVEVRKTINEAISDGFIDYDQLMAMATNLNQVAAVTGEPIELFNMKLTGDAKDLTTASRLMSNALTETENGLQVNLEGLGFNLEEGFEGAAKGLDSGLKTFADKQVEVLNGLIEFFETLVALSDGIDGGLKGQLFGDDGLLSWGEAFDKDGKLTEPFKEYIEWLNEQPAEVKNAINKTKVKIGEETRGLWEVLSDLLTGDFEGKFSLDDLANSNFLQLIETAFSDSLDEMGQNAAFIQALLSGDINKAKIALTGKIENETPAKSPEVVATESNTNALENAAEAAQDAADAGNRVADAFTNVKETQPSDTSDSSNGSKKNKPLSPSKRQEILYEDSYDLEEKQKLEEEKRKVEEEKISAKGEEYAEADDFNVKAQQDYLISQNIKQQNREKADELNLSIPNFLEASTRLKQQLNSQENVTKSLNDEKSQLEQELTEARQAAQAAQDRRWYGWGDNNKTPYDERYLAQWRGRVDEVDEIYAEREATQARVKELEAKLAQLDDKITDSENKTEILEKDLAEARKTLNSNMAAEGTYYDPTLNTTPAEARIQAEEYLKEIEKARRLIKAGQIAKEGTYYDPLLEMSPQQIRNIYADTRIAQQKENDYKNIDNLGTPAIVSVNAIDVVSEHIKRLAEKVREAWREGDLEQGLTDLETLGLKKQQIAKDLSNDWSPEKFGRYLQIRDTYNQLEQLFHLSETKDQASIADQHALSLEFLTTNIQSALTKAKTSTDLQTVYNKIDIETAEKEAIAAQEAADAAKILAEKYPNNEYIQMVANSAQESADNAKEIFKQLQSMLITLLPQIVNKKEQEDQIANEKSIENSVEKGLLSIVAKSERQKLLIEGSSSNDETLVNRTRDSLNERMSKLIEQRDQIDVINSELQQEAEQARNLAKQYPDNLEIQKYAETITSNATAFQQALDVLNKKIESLEAEIQIQTDIYNRNNQYPDDRGWSTDAEGGLTHRSLKPKAITADTVSVSGTEVNINGFTTLTSEPINPEWGPKGPIYNDSTGEFVTTAKETNNQLSSISENLAGSMLALNSISQKLNPNNLDKPTSQENEGEINLSVINTAIIKLTSVCQSMDTSNFTMLSSIASTCRSLLNAIVSAPRLKTSNIVSAIKMAQPITMHGDLWAGKVVTGHKNEQGGWDHVELSDYLQAFTNFVNSNGLSSVPETKEILIPIISNVNEWLETIKRAVQKASQNSVTIKVKASIDQINPEDVIKPGSGVSVLTAGGSGVAKGNSADAKGTLMGELGPELYVTNGRYFVAGQNGAEFVNLPDDAIVFNHLQTKRLLTNGISGRGKPVTNEKKATSWAKGNINGGPAKASAKAVLEQLIRARDFWKNIAQGLSFEDMVSNAGGGGGGGGNKSIEGFLGELERWYNLMRQIEYYQEEINHQASLYSKLQSDMIANGKAMYNTQKIRLDDLSSEVQRHEELVRSQREYYEQRVEEFNLTAYARKENETDENGNEYGLLRYDPELGRLQYVNDAVQEPYGHDMSELLQELFAKTEEGELKYTAEQQYNQLKNWGFEKAMQYDSSGKKIDKKADDFYAQSVQAFFDGIQSWQEELDGLWKEIKSQEEEIIKNEEERNKLLQEIRDNQLAVEEKVMAAVEQREQDRIDQATKEREALEKSNSKFLDGLSDALSKEQKMYQNNQDDQELTKLQRQLAILQRSGGSASEIRSLQNDINSRMQDRYFDMQQQQIDAIKDASDKQLEKLQEEIDLMTESLAYQKEHGMLWAKVAQIMQKTPEKIIDFIQEYNPEARSKSELQNAKDTQETKQQVQQWAAYYEDVQKGEQPGSMDTAHDWNNYEKSAAEHYKKVWNDKAVRDEARAAYDTEYAKSGDEVAAQIAADKLLKQKLQEYYDAHPDEAPSQQEIDLGISSGNSNSNGDEVIGWEWGRDATYHWKIWKKRNGKKSIGKKEQHTFVTSGVHGGQRCSICQYFTGPSGGGRVKGNVALAKGTLIGELGPELAVYDGQYHILGQNGAEFTNLPKDAVVFNHRQTAQLLNNGKTSRGTPVTSVANALKQTATNWKDSIYSNSISSFEASMIEFQNEMQAMAKAVQAVDSRFLEASNDAVVIENAYVTMNATISNDYDARRAGQLALEEMVKIARKTSVQNIGR